MSDDIPADPSGFQFFGADGRLVFEIGPRVVEANPAFAEKLGAVAAGWAQAEATLSCLLATLMDTSPEKTFALLTAYKSATNLIEGARQLCRAVLSQEEQVVFLEVLRDLDAVRLSRNRFQHDLWASIQARPDALYPLKPVDYTKFLVNLFAQAKETESSETREDAAQRFGAIGQAALEHLSSTRGVTVDDLEALRAALNAVNWRLFGLIGRHVGKTLEANAVPASIVSLAGK